MSRTIGLFNMAYGTTGLVSAISLDRVDGRLVSLWVIVVGAAAFLGVAAVLRTRVWRLAAHALGVRG